MFGLFVRFDLKPGAEESFDALVRETLSRIASDEPGTLIYACHEVDGAPSSRAFYELYRDPAAFEEHERQEHVRRFLREREQYLAGPPRVEFLGVQAAKGAPIGQTQEPS